MKRGIKWLDLENEEFRFFKYVVIVQIIICFFTENINNGNVPLIQFFLHELGYFGEDLVVTSDRFCCEDVPIPPQFVLICTHMLCHILAKVGNQVQEEVFVSTSSVCDDSILDGEIHVFFIIISNSWFKVY